MTQPPSAPSNGLDLGLAGRRALVTGAARGLGFAIAAALRAQGARVAINDRTPEAVARAIDRLGGPVDLVDATADLATADGPAEAVERAASGLGGLDLLVNNAAVNVERPIAATDAAHWDLHLTVDLRAPYLATRAALPHLRAAHGAVVNVASELGLQAIPDNVAYVAAKHGLVAMTRAMALELACEGVRVNAIAPGTIDTELVQDCARDSGDPAAYRLRFARFAPLHRMAPPEEIATLVLVLLSPASAFVTGAVLAADGGSTAGWPA